MTVRKLAREDWPAVLALNQASVRELSALDEPRLGYILAIAHRSLVVEDDSPDGQGRVLAFAIAIPPEVPYDSANYQCFAARYERFLYLDRIAVAAERRRRGLGALLYEEMERAARPFTRMVCDVNLVPRNDPSLAFHAARGYCEIGRVAHGEMKTVKLLSKELARAGS